MTEQEYREWQQENDLRPLYKMALELKCFTPTQLAVKGNTNSGGLVAYCVGKLLDNGIATRNRSHLTISKAGSVKLREEIARLDEEALQPVPA